MTENMDQRIARTVCVDYDDTIAVHVFGTWVPANGVIEQLTRLRYNGYRIIIHSSRGWDKFPDWQERIGEMRANLDSWGVPYDEIHSGQGKPAAAAYVDDKAIRFDDNWKSIVDAILVLKPE